MLIGEAIRELGVEPRSGEDVVVTLIRNGGGPENFMLSECAEWPLTIEGNVYLAGGLFRAGVVTRKRGRARENVARVLWLPFDSDLKDYLDLPLEDVLAMTDSEIASHIGRQRIDLEEAFKSIGLPIHRLDFTGHGLCAYTYLDDEAGSAVPLLPDIHKSLIKKINDLVGFRLVDPEASDPGSRITRIPGTFNRKAEDLHLGPARETRTLARVPGTATARQLGVIARGETKAPPTRVIPAHGKQLTPAAVESLIGAIAPHWLLGQKHSVSLALSGMLAKAGVPEDQALAIIEQLSAADVRPWDRQKCVRDSYNRVRSGLDIKGFYGLREYLPSDTVEFVDHLLQPLRDATATRLVIGEGARKEQELPSETVSPPESAFCGWVGSYCALTSPTTEAEPAFHLGVALTTIGALMGRHVSGWYVSAPLYGNLFTILVGDSNLTKKDTAIKRAIHVLTDPIGASTSILNHGIFVARDVGSSTALVKDLKDHQNVLLYMTEFSKLIGNARRKGTETILPTIMEAFDTPSVMQNRSIANPIEARFPYLSMMAAVQPEILSGLVTSEDLASGFANRMFFVCGEPKGPKAHPPEMDWFALKELFMDLWRARQTYTEGASVRCTPAAESLFDDWYDVNWYATKKSPPEERPLRERQHVFVRKIAFLYAVSEGATTISDAHVQRAIDIVAWMWRNISQLAGTWGRSIDGQIEQRIKDVLSRDGAMRKRVLQQKCTSRKWAGTDFSKVFDAMAKNQTILIDVAGLVALNDD